MILGLQPFNLSGPRNCQCRLPEHAWMADEIWRELRRRKMLNDNRANCRCTMLTLCIHRDTFPHCDKMTLNLFFYGKVT